MSVMDKIREVSKKQRSSVSKKHLDESEDNENMLVQTYSNEEIGDLDALKKSAEKVGGYVKEVEDEDGDTEYEVCVPHLEAKNFENIATDGGAFKNDSNETDVENKVQDETPTKKSKKTVNEGVVSKGRKNMNFLNEDDTEDDDIKNCKVSKKRKARLNEDDTSSKDISVALILAKVPNDVLVAKLEKKYNVSISVKKQRGGIAEVVVTNENKVYVDKACAELAEKIELLDVYPINDNNEEKVIANNLRAIHKLDEDDVLKDDVSDEIIEEKAQSRKRKAKFNEDDTEEKDNEEGDGLEEYRKSNVFTKIANKPIDEAEYTKEEYQAMADELRKIADDLEDGDFDDVTRLQAIRDLMPNVGKLRAGISVNEEEEKDDKDDTQNSLPDYLSIVPKSNYLKVKKFLEEFCNDNDNAELESDKKEFMLHYDASEYDTEEITDGIYDIDPKAEIEGSDYSKPNQKK